MSVSLKRRVEALEKAVAGSDEVTLSEIVNLSMLPGPWDAETVRRIDESRLGRLVRAAFDRSGPHERAMDAQEPEQPSASPADPANGVSLEELVLQSYRYETAPLEMEKRSVIEPVAEPQLDPSKPQPPALIPAEPGLSLDALILRDRAVSPPARVEQNRQAFDRWVAQNMLWPEPER